MKKYLNNSKAFIIFVLLAVFIILVSNMIINQKSYAIDNTKIKVTDWATLKSAIENTDSSDINIELSNEKSSVYTANSKIAISSGKNVSITFDSAITINRANSYIGIIFENNGNLSISNSSDNIYITLDGNKSNVEANSPIIQLIGGNLNITNAYIQNNYKKSGYGGGLYVTADSSNSIVELNNVTFKANEADAGGGIFVNSNSCKMNLTNVKILDNKALKTSGGGIYAFGNLVISGEETLISNNVATTYGGGIMVKGECTLNAGVISKNKTLVNSGGGIRVDGRFIYKNGEIKENYAEENGGGIDYNGLFLADDYQNFHDNTAKGEGNDLYPNPDDNLDWTKDESLKLREINVELFGEYNKRKELYNRYSQGMTVTDKYIVFTVWLSNNDDTMFALVDKKTGKIVHIVDGDINFNHANGMTWDSKRDEFYVLINSKKIAKFKISDSYEITNLEYVDMQRSYSAIAYNDSSDGFVGFAGKVMYVMNHEFKELSSFPAPTNLTTQDMGYYDGHVYFCCVEWGTITPTQQHFFNKETFSSLIYKYDLQGNLVETLYIPNTKLYGEIESASFDEDGNIILSYVFPETINLYKGDVFKPQLQLSYSNQNLTNEDVTVTITSNEEIKSVSGWQLSSDKKKLTKTYTANKTESVSVSDLNGNTSVIEVKVGNIDKEKPILKVNYSIQKITNEDVSVTITSNEKIQDKEGWNLLDEKTLEKTYSSNKTETVKVYDEAGNFSEVLVEINNIDKEKPILKVNYSTQKKTNEDVSVTIISNEKIQDKEGWNLLDEKTLEKTYSSNKTETVKVYDEAGNFSEVLVEINNIDKEKPILKVNYSIQKMTNEDVKVTITSNEKIQDKEGWNLLDEKTLEKTYSSNKKETIKVFDLAGNASEVLIEINNIDKEKLVLDVDYSNLKITNQNVVVTIKANKNLQTINGWQLSSDKKKLTKTYTTNKTETIKVFDIAGNSSEIIVKINNIDKQKPIISVSYSAVKPTNQDIIVTLTSNEELQAINGWNLSNDRKKLTKTYTENTIGNVLVSDLAGNTVSKTVYVKYIDKEKPIIKIKYSSAKLTNQDVVVTLISNEELQDKEGWKLSSDKKELSKTYTENYQEDINVFDIAGNEVSNNIDISIIDKIAPKLKISYSETEKTSEDVTVKITSNEKLQTVNGWQLSSDKKELTRTFEENDVKNLEIRDLAGNISKVKVEISNIEKIKINDKEEISNSKGIFILIFTIIVVTFFIFILIKLKRDKKVEAN